jgi:hypothetical protein
LMDGLADRRLRYPVVLSGLREATVRNDVAKNLNGFKMHGKLLR